MSKPVCETFPEAFVNARKRKFMTLTALSNKISSTESTLSYWERGKTTPSLRYVDRIAAALNVPVGDLLGITHSGHWIVTKLPDGSKIYRCSVHDQDVKPEIFGYPVCAVCGAVMREEVEYRG